MISIKKSKRVSRESILRKFPQSRELTGRRMTGKEKTEIINRNLKPKDLKNLPPYFVNRINKFTAKTYLGLENKGNRLINYAIASLDYELLRYLLQYTIVPPAQSTIDKGTSISETDFENRTILNDRDFYIAFQTAIKYNNMKAISMLIDTGLDITDTKYFTYVLTYLDNSIKNYKQYMRNRNKDILEKKEKKGIYIDVSAFIEIDTNAITKINTKYNKMIKFLIKNNFEIGFSNLYHLPYSFFRKIQEKEDKKTIIDELPNIVYYETLEDLHNAINSSTDIMKQYPIFYREWVRLSQDNRNDLSVIIYDALMDIRTFSEFQDTNQLHTFLDDLIKKTPTANKFMGYKETTTKYILRLLEKYPYTCIVVDKASDNNISLNYCVRADENGNTYFTKNFIRTLGGGLRYCTSKNDIILIPLSICENRDKDNNHANLLIYYPQTGIVQHFEPHGNMNVTEYKQNVYKNLKILFEKKLQPYIGRVTYNSPEYLCPLLPTRKYQGFQNIENVFANTDITEDVKGKVGGFCAAWSLFFLEMSIMFPNIPSDILYKNIYDYLVGGLDIEDNIVIDRFNKLILNYSNKVASDITKTPTMTLKKRNTIVLPF